MKKVLLVLLHSVLLAGCSGQSPSVVTQPTPTLTPTRTLGTGTGTLVIDGQALGIGPGEVIGIAPGVYENLTFSNLTGTADQRITIVANDRVEVVGGELSLNDVAYLTVTGGATAKNLSLHDIRYRGIVISGRVPTALILEGIQLQNVADYAVFYSNRATYDGSEATTLTDFKLLNCDFDNAGTVMIEGELNGSGGLINNGFCLRPEVANCSFRNNATWGTHLYIGNMEAGDIHHNVVDNVNARNDNHNGIFFLKGNGAVHHNKCTNHQGNFVRFWPHSQGNTPKDVLLYNNIIWNSRKYSAFELQSFARCLIPGLSTYCNAQVYNNTAGRLNTTRPTVFVGVVLDVYNLMGGQLQLVNNLSVEEVPTSANDGIWSQQSETRPSLNSNNRYFATAAAAGLTDLSEFRLRSDSPAKGTGLYQGYLDTDYYGTKRANPPSIGAVE